MKMCKQMELIKGESLDDLQAKMNEALVNGAEFGGLDIASLTGAVIVTKWVGEIKKTLLDELEDSFGCHSCEECPFFEESGDKRRKWHTCSKTGERVLKTSRCCASYYLEEKEEKSEVSKNQREDERIRCERGGFSGMAEGIPSSGLRSLEWKEQVPGIGTNLTVNILQDSNGRIVRRGGARW